MKIVAMITIMVTAGVAARAGETMQVRDRTVTVCMEAAVGSYEIPWAMGVASKMFADIGVTIEWRRTGLGCPAQGIRVSLTGRTPDTLLPGAFACARPYDGTHIRLFYDRISEGRESSALLPLLLAHVMVHEITHILQGVSRHSDRGVMKARWDRYDYAQMAAKPLPFADEDIELIYSRLAGRAARAMVATNHRAGHGCSEVTL
jgi:hypothetical protein